MTDFTEEYALIDMLPSEIQEMRLTKDFGDLDAEEQVEAYQVRLAGERGMDAGGTTGELVYLPQRGRAGIAWAGEVIWVDASSAEEAMERYLDHNIVEDDTPRL